MHELGIMQSAMDLVARHAQFHAATKIHRITLKIGALAGVDPEALRFAFDVVTAGTPAAGAVLEIVSVAVKARCKKCADDFVSDERAVSRCPKCGQYSGDLLEGRELELSQIEMS